MEALIALTLMVQASLAVAFFFLRAKDQVELKMALSELVKSRSQLATTKSKLEEKSALIEDLQSKVNALSVSAGIRR